MNKINQARANGGTVSIPDPLGQNLPEAHGR